jgi:hypothetical protein
LLLLLLLLSSTNSSSKIFLRFFNGPDDDDTDAVGGDSLDVDVTAIRSTALVKLGLLRSNDKAGAGGRGHDATEEIISRSSRLPLLPLTAESPLYEG